MATPETGRQPAGAARPPPCGSHSVMEVRFKDVMQPFGLSCSGCVWWQRTAVFPAGGSVSCGRWGASPRRTTRSEERRSAWAITAAVVALTLLQIAIQVRFNIWNRDFFDALDKRDHDAFLWQMVLFAGAGAGRHAGGGVPALRAPDAAGLVARLAGAAPARPDAGGVRATTSMQFVEGAADNPDQRIGENTRWATAIAVDWRWACCTPRAAAGPFVGILWTLSGPLPVALGGREFGDPGLHGLRGAALRRSRPGDLVGRPADGGHQRPAQRGRRATTASRWCACARTARAWR